MKNLRNGLTRWDIVVICVIFVLGIMGTAESQVLSKNLGVTVYPSKGQSSDLQAKDETDCYKWSQQQTGIDPAAPPKQQPQAAGPDGSRVKGAARGATRGAVVGEVANDDAGKGAAVGAAAGAVRGKQQSRKAKAEQQNQAAAAQKDTFKRAFSACMEGRGYAVK
ncbi:MAG: hypothetical protein H6Q52_1139 [Deltaproteobacteria bacterium]|nr:hypothetical protein [Deltaproteobacteria bacterium]